MVFSPDGMTVASGGYDGSVRLWDTSKRRLLSALRLDDSVGAVAWIGKSLAVGAGRLLLIAEVRKNPRHVNHS